MQMNEQRYVKHQESETRRSACGAGNQTQTEQNRRDFFRKNATAEELAKMGADLDLVNRADWLASGNRGKRERVNQHTTCIAFPC